MEQGTATFQCQHPLAVLVGWRVNGTPLNVANLQNISAANVGTPNGVTTILSISTPRLVYNGITVECIATLFDGSSPQSTSPVTLRIQGTCNYTLYCTTLKCSLDKNFTKPSYLCIAQIFGENISQ